MEFGGGAHTEVEEDDWGKKGRNDCGKHESGVDIGVVLCGEEGVGGVGCCWCFLPIHPKKIELTK